MDRPVKRNIDMSVKEGSVAYDVEIRNVGYNQALDECNAYWEEKLKAITDVYNKFKHMDELLTDKKMFNKDNPKDIILYELWDAIKEKVGKDG